jgi:hypothetical protein
MFFVVIGLWFLLNLMAIFCGNALLIPGAYVLLPLEKVF